MARSSRWIFALCLSVACVCIVGTPVVAGTVQGTAFYRERIALPPEAIFEAVLLDVSRADAPSDVLGRARLAPAGAPPFRFEIGYDDAAVRAGHRYVLRASITHRDRLLFTTDRAYPVLEGGEAALEIVLVRAGRTPSRRTERDEPPRPLPASQKDSGSLTGLFRYLADAASITLCADGREVPVAMEADYLALERAYSRSRREPGEALLVELDGVVATRPNAEESLPPRPTLVVQRFLDIRPRETCLVAMSDSPLRNTYWKLVRLGGAPVEVVERQREPHLIFALHEMRVSGSGGCNRIAGPFELDDDKLGLRRLASTRMACPRGMEQEDRFLRALGTVARYSIRGSHLDLLDAAGTVVAEFEAVALR